MKKNGTNGSTTKDNRYRGYDQEVTTTGKEKPTLSLHRVDINGNP